MNDMSKCETCGVRCSFCSGIDIGKLQAKVERLRAENAEAKAMMVKAYRRLGDSHGETEKLAAELDWFRRREPWVRKHVDHCWFEKGEAVQDWEEANPKPGADQ